VADSRFIAALRSWIVALDRLESDLKTSAWSAGQSISLSDFALFPYVLRLDHLGILEFLTPTRPNVGRWYDSFRARDSYEAAITNAVPAYKIDDVRRCALKERQEIETQMAAIFASGRA
jgi:glutathione S-transferase